MRHAVLGIILAAGTTAGCAVAMTRPAAPSIVVPAAWQASGPVAGGTVNAATLSRWWDGLGDGTLSDLVGRAVAANPDLKSAQARLREARARRALAGKDYLPSVTGSGSVSTNKSSGADGRDVFDAGLDASWEPDIFGGTRMSVLASQHDLEASAADVHDTQVSLVGEVALNYIELRSYQARVGIARDNLARQEETLRLTAWREQAGLTSELDVEQAKSNVAQTRAQIPSLETGVLEAEHRLAVLVGQPPASLHGMLAVTAPIPAVPEHVAIGIPADTVRQRPDVRAAEQRLAAAAARVGQARAQLYPSLRLSGSFGIQSASVGNLLSADTVVGSLLGGLTAPIFDRGRIRAQIGIQSASEEQALIAYERTVLAALEEVENALVSLANVRRRQSALTDAVSSARQAAALARHRYTAGLVNYQTVLDTERSVLSVEDSLTSASSEGASALVRLYKALGGGWTPAAVTTPVTAARPQSEER
jgi:NodT family efflux transporter outer membrane factor (OMF) lipoprotein